MNSTIFVPSASATHALGVDIPSTMALPPIDNTNVDLLVTLQSGLDGVSATFAIGAGAPVTPGSGALSVAPGVSVLLANETAVLTANSGNPFVIGGSVAAAAGTATILETLLALAQSNTRSFPTSLAVTGGQVYVGGGTQGFSLPNAEGAPTFAIFGTKPGANFLGSAGALPGAAIAGRKWVMSGYSGPAPTALCYVNSSDAAMPANCILIGYQDAGGGVGTLSPDGLDNYTACRGVGPYLLAYAPGPGSVGQPVFGASASAPIMILSLGAPPPTLLVQRGTASMPPVGGVCVGSGWPANH